MAPVGGIRRRPGPAQSSRRCLPDHTPAAARKERGFAAPARPDHERGVALAQFEGEVAPQLAARDGRAHGDAFQAERRAVARHAASYETRGDGVGPRRASRSAISSARFPFPLVAALALAFAFAASSMVSSIAKSRSRRSVSAASPESCSKRPTTMLSAPCTVRNAYPACVTTPNSTSPAKAWAR